MNKPLYIISDNCWGLGVYQSINSKYLSPFVNLYIHPTDYIKLLYNLDDYLNCKFTEVNFEDSNHFKLHNIPITQSPIIAKLNDIEVIFYHTKNKSSDEIFGDFYRRKQRLPENKDEIIISFANDIYRYPEHERFNDYRSYSKINEILEKFYKLPYGKKVSFTSKKYNFPKNYVIHKNHSENNLHLGLNHRYYIKDIFSF